MDAENLKVWLPFDESTTADKCGNTWTAYGSPTISETNAINGQALQLNKGYLRSASAIEFGGADFTVDFYGYMNSSSESYAGFFCAQSTTNTGSNSRPGQISLYRDSSSAQIKIETYNSSGGTQTANVNISSLSLTNARHHFELDYSHANSTLKIFVDGSLTLTRSMTVDRLARYIFLGTNSYNPSSQRMVGTIDEFRLFDGVALHTDNFTPPTAEDYQDLAFVLDGGTVFTVDDQRKLSNVDEFTADVERKLKNKWRYVNLGTADSLTISGTTLTDLPDAKSITGTAFYQTAREKCFDLPATAEIWLKFDVYFDGSNRWRAYNGGTNGTTGITAQTDGQLSFFTNGGNNQGNFSDVCKTNQLQTVLLHMISGSSGGIVEAWVDGNFIYRYTGDVNHGEDFADIYLQSDGSGTFFSNVIISNVEIGLGEGYQSFLADVERKVNNVIPFEFTADVSRVVKNDAKLSEALRVWLPFDKSVTEDKCLNDWETYGTPTIGETNAINGKALQLDGSSYLKMKNQITLGGRDFTIDGWLYMDSSTPAQACIVQLEKELGYPLLFLGKESPDPKHLWIAISPTSDVSTSAAETTFRESITRTEIVNRRVHFELDYQFNEQLLHVYINGVLSHTLKDIVQFERMNFTLTLGYFYRTWGTDANRDYYFKGYLDEFRIFDGLALHTAADFTPPTTITEYNAITPLSKEKSFYFDVERVVKNSFHTEFTSDVIIRDILSVTFAADTVIRDVLPVEFTADVAIRDGIPFEFTADVVRSIPAKLKLFTVDNSSYFPSDSGGTGETISGGDVLPADSPVVIPQEQTPIVLPLATVPPAPNNTSGLQSMEITLSEQQLTDSVHFVSAFPVGLLLPVIGQYFDYVFNMRVERVQQQGVLCSCDCCSDIDALLYTQLAYKIPDDTKFPSEADDDTDTDTDSEDEKKYPLASMHALCIATVLGKFPIMQFGDFVSTVLVDEKGGVTFGDLIRDIFGWSSRVPTHMINVFIRGGHIFFIQRGYETRLIDLTFTKHTLPIITQELIRTTWGSTPWSKTETREYTPETTGTTSSGSSGSSDSGDDSGDDDDDTEQAWTNTGQTITEDRAGRTITTNYYNGDGVLMRVVAEYTSFSDEKENNIKTTTNRYNNHDLLKSTRTEISYPNDSESNSKVETTYGYMELPDGKMFLSTEMTTEYDSKGEVVDHKVTTRSPTGRGQSTSADDGGNTNSNGDKGDDRTTPYQRSQTGSTAKAFADAKNPNSNKEKESRTINGLSLYDSSFPIHNVDKLIELTNAIRWLNRKTKETVTMTIYEYPHIIDFNDRIIFNGATYFLVSNTATTNNRVFNEQKVTFVRWY